MNKSVASVLVGLAIAVALVIGSALVFFFVHHDSHSASAAMAEAEFSQLRARFAGQPAERAAQGLHSFHTVIFDTRGGQRLVHITVPYWFGRRFAGRAGEFRWLGQLTFLDDTEFDPEAIQLSLAEVERRGPGLLFDYRHPGGGQFISWVE